MAAYGYVLLVLGKKDGVWNIPISFSLSRRSIVFITFFLILGNASDTVILPMVRVCNQSC